MSNRKQTSGASAKVDHDPGRAAFQQLTGRSSLAVSDEVRQKIERWARSSTLPHRQVQRSRILLGLANGWSSSAIARELGVSRETVRRWRDRARTEGVDTLLADRPGRGRRAGRNDETVERVRRTRAAHPRWTLRQIAAHVDASLATVQRICRDELTAAARRPVN